MTNEQKLREATSRLSRLWCWLWYGHSHEPGGRTVDACSRCGAKLVGGS